MLDNNQVFILRRSQVHTTEFCLNFTRLILLACCSQQRRSVHALAREIFLVQTDSHWVRMDKVWLQTTRYEMAVCTKRLDTITKSKLLSTVFNKRPSTNFFFLRSTLILISSLIPMSAPFLFQ